MRLQEKSRTPTIFRPPRGLGLASIPNTGEQSLQSATFQTSEEVRGNPDLKFRPGRLFLGRVDGDMIGIDDPRHILTVAGTRSGKSACLLIPNLWLYPGPVIVLDPKGELAEATALRRAEQLGHEVIVLDPFGITKGKVTDGFRHDHDLLRELDVASPSIIDDASALAEALVIQTGNDLHWTLAARNLLVGLILLAKFGEKPRTLSDLQLDLSEGSFMLWNEMISLGHEASDETIAGQARLIVESVGKSFLHKNPNEAASIISTAQEQLAFARSPAMRALFRNHGPSLRTLKSGLNGKPVTVYIVLPAGRMETHNRWLRALVSLALIHFEAMNEKTAHPILMVLEEFAALGHLRPVEQAAGFIAGSGVRLWTVLQDLSQLQHHYKNVWETFIGNAGIVQAFSVSDLTTCDYLSRRLGQTTLEVANRQVQTAAQRASGVPAARREFRDAPLLSPSEIALTFARRSKGGQTSGGLTLVLTPDDRPFVVDRVHWSELED